MNFIAKENELLTLDGEKAYMVLKCIEFENENYYVLDQIYDTIEDIKNIKKPFVLAKQIIKGEDMYLEMVGNKKLQEKIIKMLDTNEVEN